jgi:hypothetical protein
MRHVPRLVWGGLAASALLHLALFFTDGFPSYEDGAVGMTFMIVMLFPAFAYVSYHWVLALGPRSAFARAFSRRLLAGMAGGLILWCGAYHGVAWCERYWAEREALLLPAMINGRVSIFAPMEARAADIFRENVARVLAEEGAGEG